MSGQFSVGVVIGGMIGSTFRSAMSGPAVRLIP